jgi:inositol phosphorylceramide synthase catalytic subunit
LNDALRHIARLWPRHRVLLPLVFPAWASMRFLRGEGRWEHLLLLLLAPTLAFVSERTKKLFLGLLPFALLAVTYDAMAFVEKVGVTATSVHLCDLRALDMRLLHLTSGGQLVSLHDWLRAHEVFALDVLFAIPYGTFIYASIAFAIFLYVRAYDAMRHYGWTFLAVNLMGFVIYHLYPAAPPWYYHAHGCTVDLAARASEGPNLARVDAWLKLPYFASFYGRASDVFGAMPSLHITYPLLIAVYGYRQFGVVLRVIAIVYFVLMCVAAVYLDHHWVIDVLAGIACTGIVLGVRRAAHGMWMRAAFAQGGSDAEA